MTAHETNTRTMLRFEGRRGTPKQIAASAWSADALVRMLTERKLPVVTETRMRASNNYGAPALVETTREAIRSTTTNDMQQGGLFGLVSK